MSSRSISMSSVQSNLPLAFLSNERDFPSLIKWVESIPVSHLTQDYLAIAVVIQQDVEPIIRKKEPQIALQGNVLSSEITQSKGFIYQREKLLPSRLDPAFLPLLNSDETPLRESIVLTKTEETVNKLSKVILLICRIDKDQSTLEYFCQGAIQEINRMRDSIKGSFSVSAQALISDSPCFPPLADSAEPRLLASPQDLINQSIEKREQPVFALEPREGMILERHFDHGKKEETDMQLSIVLKDHEIVTTQKKNIVNSNFTDLRYESEESISLPDPDDRHVLVAAIISQAQYYNDSKIR